ncbi:MAG: GNAT family N-acetyltransferase [Tepidisphaeraceae bacterium]
MALKATWLGRESIERIADIRLRCYGNSPGERDAFIRKTEIDCSADGDVLVLADDTGDVATATSLSLTMNVRGTHLPCQGVAWVGTVRSHRRRRIDGHGLASTVMHALANKARERGQAVSMLAPFRVSFYESFGYGIAERQNEWTVPLRILPDGDAGQFAEYRDADFDSALASRRRQFERTHGDIRTDAVRLDSWIKTLQPLGFRMIDRQGDRVVSQFTLGTEIVDGRAIAVVHRPFYESIDALKRLLTMLGTLKDQYSAARVGLPADLPINWLLAERQVPHRRVDHPAARCRAITRMQVKIAETPEVIAALTPANGVSGLLTIDVAGQAWRIEIADGHATATTSTHQADLACDAKVWAALVMGDLPVKTAADLGLLTAGTPAALPLLADLVAGPAPFCHEYF